MPTKSTPAPANTAPPVDLSASRYDVRDGQAHFRSSTTLPPLWTLSDEALAARDAWQAVNAAAVPLRRACNAASAAVREARTAQERGRGTTAAVDAAIEHREAADAALAAHGRRALAALKEFDRLAQASRWSPEEYAAEANRAQAEATEAARVLRAALERREHAYQSAGWHVGTPPTFAGGGPAVPWRPEHYAGHLSMIGASLAISNALDPVDRIVRGFPDEVTAAPASHPRAAELARDARMPR